VKKTISKKGKKHKQKVEVVTEEFTGKNLTRFGGTGLIRRFLKHHKIEKALQEKVTVEGRRESKYSVGGMFVSLLYGIFLGYSRPSHMEVLSTDSVFQKAAGLFDFPVQSTISRFLSGLKVKVAHRLALLNFDLLMEFRGGFKGFKEITLDLDSHVTSVYGSQQRTGIGYNPKKKGRKSYHPLFCFIGETRDYIAGLLRSGKHHTSYNAIPFLKGVIKKLPSHIEKIKLRADSGFFSIDMLKFLIRRSIEFYVVVPMQPWVQKKIKYITGWRGMGKGIEVSKCDYVLTKDIAITMVFIRQGVRNGESPKKQLKLLHTEDVIYDYQVIVTNSDIPPEEVWRFYNQRACCENFIKEGVYSFGLDKVVSHYYGGNYAYFELLMLAYNLINFFKEEVLNQEKIKNMAHTIRERLFLIPGRLISTRRRWVLRLESTWFYKQEYEEALARVT
jgi:hypothetical protein